MLSRIAESLYWVGRYVERAEDTARILDVHVHHVLEGSGADEATARRALLGAMGAKSSSAEPDSTAVNRILAFDESNPCSIVGSLRAARENARGSREMLSSEMWECLNAAYHALPGRVADADEDGPYEFFGWVKERAAVVAGLADSTMTRDDGWRFLVLGRSLERIDMTTRLLLTCFGGLSGSLNWVTTLRSCAAHEAFLRTYQRSADGPMVAEFLLLDRLFPRSALFTLRLAETCLAEVSPGTARAGMDDEARRVLGRARTELEFTRRSDLVDALPDRLRGLQKACAEAGGAVTQRFFDRRRAGDWQLEGAERP